MRADYLAVLDACVLLPMPLADTLLRFAEHPRLYLPRWTDEIMAEVTRNLVTQFNQSSQAAQHGERELRKAFPEAWVDGYQPLVDKMQNNPKDRHVLAAAVKACSELIVTYNAKHFPAATLKEWGVERRGPSTFLIDLYDLDPGLAIHKLHEQADATNRCFEKLLSSLHKAVPGFVQYVCGEQHIELSSLKRP